jgi:hypothetical protein
LEPFAIVLAISKARISTVLVSLAAIQDLMRENAVLGVFEVSGYFVDSDLYIWLEDMSFSDACKIKETTSGN